MDELEEEEEEEDLEGDLEGEYGGEGEEGAQRLQVEEVESHVDHYENYDEDNTLDGCDEDGHYLGAGGGGGYREQVDGRGGGEGRLGEEFDEERYADADANSR